VDPATHSPRAPGIWPLLRLCLGFVGGWWLLQFALLGTGLIAFERAGVAMSGGPGGGWRQYGPLVAAAMALPLLHLVVALWLRRRLDAGRRLVWAAVNGATGMLTSLLLVGGLLVAGLPDAEAIGLDPGQPLVRGVKNLAVLILATAILCSVFAGPGPGFKMPLAALARRRPHLPAAGAAVLDGLRPVYFLAVFAENLCAPFLPGLLRDAVAQAHLPADAASALFMAYFVAFTAVLVPAGWLLARFQAAALIKAGAVLLAVGLLLPALSLAPWPLAAARLAAGAGQGVLLIGVQALILGHTDARRRTAGTSIIVFGFNGGMVGGNAFGSLLVDRFGPQAVFAIAAIGAVGVVVAAVILLAGVRGADEDGAAGASRRWDAAGLRCLFDGGFLATTLCIGIPTKAVLTGVVLFALPLLLVRRGFDLEQVGQIAMFYAVGVLAATSVVARLGHRLGTAGVLVVGALCSAVGIAALGMAGPPMVGNTAMALIACVLVLGIAHGCINAPVVTHVADLPIAGRFGPVRVASSYRLVERVGHVGGPLVAERCLAAAGEGPALAGIAVVVAAAALVFLAHHARRRHRP
jgi:MFS family permease